MRTDLPPLPASVKPGASSALSARVPADLHWWFKVTTMSRATSMTEVVSALLTVYIEDPERVDAAIAYAASRGITLGDVISEALAGKPAQIQPMEL